MFGTLLESRARPVRRRGGATLSVVVHVATIASVAAVTARSPAEMRRPTHATAVIYVEPPRRPWVPPPSAPRRTPAEPSVVVAEQTIVVELPAVVPPTLPPITDGPPIDWSREVRVVGSGTSVVRGDPGTVVAAPAEGTPFLPTAAERMLSLAGRVPAPRYPDALRSASVTGRVVVRFIVDTLGRVEPASVVVVASSHDLFERAVRSVLPELRFLPAEAGGRKVRMLAEMPFEFALR